MYEVLYYNTLNTRTFLSITLYSNLLMGSFYMFSLIYLTVPKGPA